MKALIEALINIPINSKTFKVGDTVYFKPYPDCPHNAISGSGRVEEVLTGIDTNCYMVRFGFNSMYGTRLCKLHCTTMYMWV